MVSDQTKLSIETINATAQIKRLYFWIQGDAQMFPVHFKDMDPISREAVKIMLGDLRDFINNYEPLTPKQQIANLVNPEDRESKFARFDYGETNL